jgi:hypothetical protein
MFRAGSNCNLSLISNLWAQWMQDIFAIINNQVIVYAPSLATWSWPKTHTNSALGSTPRCCEHSVRVVNSRGIRNQHIAMQKSPMLDEICNCSEKAGQSDTFGGVTERREVERSIAGDTSKQLSTTKFQCTYVYGTILTRVLTRTRTETMHRGHREHTQGSTGDNTRRI